MMGAIANGMNAQLPIILQAAIPQVRSALLD
jgi:hypothetical protein